MTAREQLAAHLRSCRKAAKMTQPVVAAALEIDPSQVSRWENGRQLPKQSRARALADLYNADLAEMRERIGAAYEEEAEELGIELDSAAKALAAIDRITDRLDGLERTLKEIVAWVRRNGG